MMKFTVKISLRIEFRIERSAFICYELSMTFRVNRVE
jgi:hypothetical protein